MSISSIIKKFGTDLFFYYLKGARIDGALQWAGRSRIPMSEFPRPGAIPIEDNGIQIVYDAADILRQWKITVRGTLILKNNSKNFAYNIALLNAGEIFDSCDPISKLTSIAPNDKMEMKVSFVQYAVAHSGLETQALPDIPTTKENQYLRIQYENERGTLFLTKFLVSFSAIKNVYTYK